MATPLDQNRIDTIGPLSGFPSTVKNVPPNYPQYSTPGKIALLFNANSQNLYHRFSPYNQQGMDLFGWKDKQPFVWRYPDEGKSSLFDKLPSVVTTVSSALGGPTKGTTDDLVRVSKFIGSPSGVLFVGKQLLLQRGQSFTETRIYNPASPILATISPMSLGLGDHPMRHIDGGIVGLLNSITSTVGLSLPVGGQSVVPPGTYTDALPKVNSDQGKGLTRAPTSTQGYTNLTNFWKVDGSTGNKGTPSLGSMIKSAASNLIGSVANSFMSVFSSGTDKPPGKYRADEDTYMLMINSYKLKKGTQMGLYDDISYIPQMWYAGKPKGISSRNKMFRQSDGFKYQDASNGILSISIKGRSTGYTLNNTDVYSGKGTNNGIQRTNDDELTNSDMLVQFGLYNQNDFPTKLTNVESITKALKSTMTSINDKSSYKASVQVYNYLMSNGSEVGYSNMFNKVPKDLTNKTPKNSYGIGFNYYYDGAGNAPRTIDKSMGSKHLHMATSFTSDGINKLGILKGNGSDNVDISVDVETGWTSWKPYHDDLIAFYFYDVVNDKFIPFRATVKGISEGGNAYWDELRFIGRADQIYSYNGFNRTLTFSFNIVINSITELLPTWKKINYLKSAIKPSNYTKKDNKPFNRFIVPPMFMITIGDLYRFQPIVINSVDVNIPDDASWETLNEINTENGWSYLNGIITNSSIGKNYAQLPREVEISVNGNLLEKERSIVGGTNFGHAPFNDTYADKDDRLQGGKVYLPAITKFHKDMTEFQESGAGGGCNQDANEERQVIPINENPSEKVIQSTPIPLISVPPFNPTSTPTFTGASVGSVVVPITPNKTNNVLPSAVVGQTITPTQTAIPQTILPNSTAELQNGGAGAAERAAAAQQKDKLLFPF